MAETWYRINDWDGDVEVAEVVASTDKTVVVGDRRHRHRITSDWRCYRRTRRECLEWLVEARTKKFQEAQSSYDSARERLERREEELHEAQKLLAKEPPP